MSVWWASLMARWFRSSPAGRVTKLRGNALLRLVAEAPRLLAELDAEAVTALERDGLVRVDGELVALPL